MWGLPPSICIIFRFCSLEKFREVKRTITQLSSVEKFMEQFVLFSYFKFCIISGCFSVKSSLSTKCVLVLFSLIRLQCHPIILHLNSKVSSCYCSRSINELSQETCCYMRNSRSGAASFTERLKVSRYVCEGCEGHMEAVSRSESSG